ncbi:MAG: GNAT family N-acetyltransferase [Odoribacter sp.]
MPEEVIIRKIVKKDLPDVVRVHKNAFNSFFLTTLGTSFLTVYYRSVLKSLNAIVIGAYLDEKLIGFGVGAIVAKGFNKKLVLDNVFSFGWEAFKILFRNPHAILQLKNNFSKIGDIEDAGMYSELFSIAVEPSISTQGIGSAIIDSFEQRAKENGAKEVSLTTDFYDNEGTLSFYKKNGYRLYYEFVAYPNRKMYRFIKQI